MPLADFLAAHFPGDRWKELRRAVQAYVEGFHAAPASRASTHGLFATEQVVDVRDLQFRILEGTAALVQALGEALATAVHPNTIATRIRWKPGRAEVDACSPDGDSLGPFRGAQALVTVPSGV